MWVKGFIRYVAPKISKIGKTVRIDAPTRLKLYTPDPKKLRHAFWTCARDLSKEIALKTVPGTRWFWKSLKGSVDKIRSGGFCSGKLREKREKVSRLENENLSLKEMRERISMLERENSCLRKLKTNWQHRCIMLMASMLGLATEAEMTPWKTRALLLTISDRLLPSDHCMSDDVLTRVEAKPEDCIRP